MSSPSTIRPNEGEQYSAFVHRAHSQLLHSIPDPYKRNQTVWSAWESQHGDPVADRASEYFPSEKYRFVPKSVCYFREHTASKPSKKPGGKPIVRKYDFNELARIVDAANDKCDSDSYSGIASHHNGPLKGPDHEPTITGYMGEHRLGMIGRKTPIFAVFVDEYHNKQHAQMFDDRRRRSVEVLHHIDGRPPFFDPVALLGSEPPRLPLPVAKYQADASEFESYSYVSDFDPELDQYSEFTSAGGSNTFIPGGQNRHDNYQSDQQTMNSNLSPEDITAITNAIMATPQMQFVSQLMEQGNQQPGTGQQPDQNGQGQAAQGQTGPDMGGTGGTDDLGLQDQGNIPAKPNHPAQTHSMNPLRQPRTGLTSASDSVAGSSGAYSQHYSTGDQEDMSTERYAAVENELYEMRDKYSLMETNNTKLVQSNLQLVQEIAQTKKTVAHLQARNSDADRELIIRDLYSKYPHFVQPDEEFERCLYSKNSKMSDEEFTLHVADVEKYAKRSPVATAMVPLGTFGARPVNNDQEAHVADLVVERYSAAVNNGNYDVTYDSIEADIRKQLVS